METTKKKNPEYDCISALPEGMLITKDEGFKFCRTLPNPERRKKKLAKFQKTQPSITYADIVKSSQLYYGMKNRHAEKSIDITFDVVEKEIIKKLGELHIDEDNYQVYVDFLSKELDKIEVKKRRERDAYNLQINKLTSNKNTFIKKCGF